MATTRQSQTSSSSAKTHKNPAGTGHRREVNISAEQLRRVKGYQRMAAGLIFIILPCAELYRRLYRDGERKMQEGEFNPVDGSIKKYTEEEKIEAFKGSWLTRIFGEK